MTTQTPPTEERLSRLEGAYEQLGERMAELRSDTNERLNDLARGQAALRSDMNARIDDLARGQAALRSDVNARLSDMNQRLSDMNSRINVMLVLVGGIWATTIAGIIALTQF